jgi:hypothetical protein
MTETIQLIIAVSQFCSTVAYDRTGFTPREAITRACYERIWDCGHSTTDASTIAVKTHNCIDKYLKGKLK